MQIFCVLSQISFAYREFFKICIWSNVFMIPRNWLKKRGKAAPPKLPLIFLRPSKLRSNVDKFSFCKTSVAVRSCHPPNRFQVVFQIAHSYIVLSCWCYFDSEWCRFFSNSICINSIYRVWSVVKFKVSIEKFKPEFIMKLLNKPIPHQSNDTKNVSH